MPQPLSKDLRKRIAEAVHSGMSCNAAAKRFSVAPSTAIKLIQAEVRTGSLAPKQMGGYRKAILGPRKPCRIALAATP